MMSVTTILPPFLSHVSLSTSVSLLTLTTIARAIFQRNTVCCRDGVIEASIDHSNGWLLSNDVVDLYSTEEPQKAFHKYVLALNIANMT